jgi:hypothetical protein
MGNSSQTVRAIIRHNRPQARPIWAPKNRELPWTLASYPNEEPTMSASIRQINGNSLRTLNSAWQAGSTGTWWSQHREASLNWLALGVLLAAWNASDNRTAAPPQRRPETLRGYSSVSVRAARRPELTAASRTSVPRY